LPLASCKKVNQFSVRLASKEKDLPERRKKHVPLPVMLQYPASAALRQ
jgi:hypothetical protein